MEECAQDPVEFACDYLCTCLDFSTELFQGDAVAAFNFKTPRGAAGGWDWAWRSHVGRTMRYIGDRPWTIQNSEESW